MSKGFKITVVVLLLVIVAGSIVAYKMFTTPRRDATTEQALAVTATQLVSDYQHDETAANAKYLNQAVKVIGSIAQTGSNQDGHTTLMLASGDAMTSVFCTLQSADTTLKAGQQVTIKGICHGMLSDVRVSDAVVVSPDE